MIFLILHIFLLLLFSGVGIFGLVFQVSGAAFLGLTLVPWEIRLMLLVLRKNNPVMFKTLIITAAVVGIGFFSWLGDWKTLLFFIVAEAYMFYLVSRKKKKTDILSERVEDQK